MFVECPEFFEIDPSFLDKLASHKARHLLQLTCSSNSILHPAVFLFSGAVPTEGYFFSMNSRQVSSSHRQKLSIVHKKDKV